MPELLSENTLPVPGQNSAFNEEQLPVRFPSLGKHKADCPKPRSAPDPSFQPCCGAERAGEGQAAPESGGIHIACTPSLARSFLWELRHPGMIPPPKRGLEGLAMIFSL